jgi:galactokinase
MIEPQGAAPPPETLRQAGLTPDAAASKAALFERAADALERAGETAAEATALYVPGRVEVLGKHVDYAGGSSLTCAADRGFCAFVVPRTDRALHMRRAADGAHARLPLDGEPGGAPGDWRHYPRVAARRLARNFPSLQRGATVVFDSDLPAAAGMSSSSALITLVAFAVARANGWLEARSEAGFPGDAESLAGYLGAVESGANFEGLPGDAGVGTAGGSQDHTAIVASRAGRVSRFGYAPVTLERRVPLPAGWGFVVGVSGCEAVKTGNAMAAYNDAARAAADATAHLRAKGFAGERLKAIVAAYDVAALRSALADAPEALRNRFEHFYAENEQIVPEATEALARGDLAAFGVQADRSQALAERWLNNQMPQTSHLARAARAQGAAAASAFGAGFGGSVWALVRAADAEAFARRWAEDCRAAHPHEAERARFLPLAPGPPAMEPGRGSLAQMTGETEG